VLLLRSQLDWAAFLTVPVVFFIAVVFSGLRALYDYGVAGAWGYWDYYAATGPAVLRAELPSLPSFLILFTLTVLALFLFFIPLRHRLGRVLREPMQ